MCVVSWVHHHHFVDRRASKQPGRKPHGSAPWESACCLSVRRGVTGEADWPRLQSSAHAHRDWLDGSPRTPEGRVTAGTWASGGLMRPTTFIRDDEWDWLPAARLCSAGGRDGWGRNSKASFFALPALQAPTQTVLIDESLWMSRRAGWQWRWRRQ